MLLRLAAQSFEFPFIGLGLCRADEAAQIRVARYRGAVFRLDEEFEVGLRVWFVADFVQKKRINVPGCRDEVQIAANTCLCRVDVAKIVHAINDPEFFVASREVQDLLVLWEHDKSGKSELGSDLDDVPLGIFYRACCRGVRHGGRRSMDG